MARGIKTGGRQKGSKNKIAADVRALAQEYGAEAIETLVSYMRKPETEQTAISACKELLDRGYGKSVAIHEVDTTHHYVAEVPAVAANTEEWLKQHAPQTIQ